MKLLVIRVAALAMLVILTPPAPAAPADAPATTQSSAVKITKHPPTVQHRTFDRKNPPKDMPKLVGNEAAVAVPDFECQTKVEVNISTPGDGGKATVTIVEVSMDLRLDTTVWLPKDSTPKLRAHEEGHHQIVEMFYDRAEPVARSLAEKHVGRKLDIDGRNDAAVDAEIKKTINEIGEPYLDRIARRAAKANDVYDQITEHGTNKVPEKEAIRRALTAAPLPSTQP